MANAEDHKIEVNVGVGPFGIEVPNWALKHRNSEVLDEACNQNDYKP